MKTPEQVAKDIVSLAATYKFGLTARGSLIDDIAAIIKREREAAVEEALDKLDEPLTPPPPKYSGTINVNLRTLKKKQHKFVSFEDNGTEPEKKGGE